MTVHEDNTTNMWGLLAQKMHESLPDIQSIGPSRDFSWARYSMHALAHLFLPIRIMAHSITSELSTLSFFLQVQAGTNRSQNSES
jgi:hypothetical protein